jgi:CRP/FNR family transcriptional regulator
LDRHVIHLRERARVARGEGATVLRAHPLFARVERAVVDACVGLFTQRAYAAGERIFEQGDLARMLYAVGTGKVRVSRHAANGKDVTLAILGGGDALGMEQLFDPAATRSGRAVCITDTRLYVARCRDVTALLSRSAALTFNVARYLNDRHEEAVDTIENLSLFRVRDRIVRVLERLADDHGCETENGTRIEVRLTHAHIASLVGSTRETVSLELNALRRAGQLTSDRRYFMLPRASWRARASGD